MGKSELLQPGTIDAGDQKASTTTSAVSGKEATSPATADEEERAWDQQCHLRLRVDGLWRRRLRLCRPLRPGALAKAWLSGPLEEDDGVDVGWLGFGFDLHVCSAALFAGGDKRSGASGAIAPALWRILTRKGLLRSRGGSIGLDCSAK